MPLVWLLAALAAVDAALAGAHPTGLTALDAALAAALAALAVLAAARAAPWAVTAAAAAATLASVGQPTTAVPAGLATAVAAVAWNRGLRPPERTAAAVQAVVTAVTVHALLRIPWAHPTGASALLTAALLALLGASAWPSLSSRARRLARRGALALAALAVASALLLAVVALAARPSLTAGLDAARAGLDAAGAGDRDGAVAALARAADRFATAHRWLASPLALPARLVPGLAPQSRALTGMAAAGEDLTRAAADAADDADVDALTVQAGRLDPARVAALRKPLARASEALADTERRLDGLASPWLAVPLAGAYDDLAGRVADAREGADTATLAAEVAPGLLGGERPRRYLVVFLSPAEARGGGGFLGNYAELSVVDGDIEMTRFGRHEELSAVLALAGGPAAVPGVQAELDAYFPDPPLPDLPWQRASAPPDLPTLAGVVERLWAASGGDPVEGVVTVDPRGIAAFLQLTGPIEVEGLSEPLTAANAADVVLRRQYTEFPDRGERLDFLDEAARTTFERLTTGDLPGPRTVADALSPAVHGGAIAVHLDDPDEQRLFDRVDAGGAMPPVTSDALELVTQNAGANKIDVFLRRSLRYEADVDARTGAIAATATITLTNEAPAAGLPANVIGNIVGQPDGTNVTYLSLYTPLALTGATLGGEPVDAATAELLGRRAHSLLVDVPAGSSVTLVLSLAGTVDTGGGYHLAIGRQPVVAPDEVQVDVRVDGGPDVHAGGPLVEPLELPAP
ncbi:MAG: DUF4012 domain-containing protein [Acidimicrobiales bacterium]|nr:DUF4012 domain-containing protein [Acidimicrobiales bacterium]